MPFPSHRLRTTTVPTLILAMIGFGYFKGLYDANIFASLYDVVPIARRGAAAGTLNSLGWLPGGGLAPIVIAIAAKHSWAMSVCGLPQGYTAAIYLFIGLLMLWAARRVTPPAA